MRRFLTWLALIALPLFSSCSNGGVTEVKTVTMSVGDVLKEPPSGDFVIYDKIGQRTAPQNILDHLASLKVEPQEDAYRNAFLGRKGDEIHALKVDVPFKRGVRGRNDSGFELSATWVGDYLSSFQYTEKLDDRSDGEAWDIYLAVLKRYPDTRRYLFPENLESDIDKTVFLDSVGSTIELEGNDAEPSIQYRVKLCMDMTHLLTDMGKDKRKKNRVCEFSVSYNNRGLSEALSEAFYKSVREYYKSEFPDDDCNELEGEECLKDIPTREQLDMRWQYEKGFLSF